MNPAIPAAEDFIKSLRVIGFLFILSPDILNSLFLKMLPFVFHPLHKLLEARLAADVVEEPIILVDEGIIDDALIDRILQPV
jgi:hypothetical protein